MLAKDGAKYAQVVHGKCHWIFTKEQLAEWNEDDILAVEITDQDVKIGELYADGVFLKPMLAVVDEVDVAKNVRIYRDVLISLTDWTQLPDVPAETTEKFQVYRKALRDISLQEGFPLVVEWPVKPT